MRVSVDSYPTENKCFTFNCGIYPVLEQYSTDNLVLGIEYF